MKKLLALVLALSMIFGLAACGQTAKPAEAAPATEAPKAQEPAKEPAAAEAPKATEEPAPAAAEAFLWDNFDDRDPNNKPELAPNGVNIWWDNWANLRAKNEDGAIKLDMRPKAFDPEDFESEADYYAHAADWMANWGEAVNMWALDGISWPSVLRSRMPAPSHRPPPPRTRPEPLAISRDFHGVPSVFSPFPSRVSVAGSAGW